MIDLNHCNEWQHICPETGLVLPWYTKSFLDELVTWDLKDKVVLEIGMGASTLWWNKKAAWVTGFELNKDWYYAVTEKIDFTKGTSFLPMEGELVKAMGNLLTPCEFDVAIIDCEPIEWRDKSIPPAIEYLKAGGRLIIDNWDQPSVWVPSEETRKLLSDWPVEIYKQEGHPDWQTAVFTKP